MAEKTKQTYESLYRMHNFIKKNYEPTSDVQFIMDLKQYIKNSWCIYHGLVF